MKELSIKQHVSVSNETKEEIKVNYLIPENIFPSINYKKHLEYNHNLRVKCKGIAGSIMLEFPITVFPNYMNNLIKKPRECKIELKSKKKQIFSFSDLDPHNDDFLFAKKKCVKNEKMTPVSKTDTKKINSKLLGIGKKNSNLGKIESKIKKKLSSSGTTVVNSPNQFLEQIDLELEKFKNLYNSGDKANAIDIEAFIIKSLSDIDFKNSSISNSNVSMNEDFDHSSQTFVNDSSEDSLDVNNNENIKTKKVSVEKNDHPVTNNNSKNNLIVPPPLPPKSNKQRLSLNNK